MRFCGRLSARVASVNPSNAERRSIRVAIIGTPNVGKSALTNQLIKADVCAVSKLIDTTRRNLTASVNEGQCQIVVIDSPGLVGLAHAKKMIQTDAESPVLVDPEKALRSADHVLVIDDATSPGMYVHHRVLHMLHRNPHIPSSLVLNKCDLIKNRTSLLERAHKLANGIVNEMPIATERIKTGRLGKAASAESLSLRSITSIQGRDENWLRSYNNVINKPTHKCTWTETKNVFQTEHGWPHFSALFFVSALDGSGIQQLRDHLVSLSLPTEHWRFNDGISTNKSPAAIASEHIRSMLLNHIPSDIAYAIRVKIVHWEMNESGLVIVAHIRLGKDRWAKFVSEAAQEHKTELDRKLSTLFKCEVVTQLLPILTNGSLCPQQ